MEIGTRVKVNGVFLKNLRSTDNSNWLVGRSGTVIEAPYVNALFTYVDLDNDLEGANPYPFKAEELDVL